MSKIIPQEGVGVTLWAQVRHLVTYRDPLRGPLFTPFLPKSVKNGAKRGYPLFMTGKLTVSPTWGVCRPGGPSRAVLWPHFGHQMGLKNDFWACTRV